MTANKPVVVINYPLDVIEIRKLKAVFRHVNASKQVIKTLRLSQENFNNLFNYFLNRYFEIATNIVFVHNELDIKISLHLPENSVGNYLNIGFKLNYQDNRLFKFHSLQIGHLLIADEFSQFFLQILSHYSTIKDSYALVKKAVKRIEVTPDYLTLVYHFESSSKKGSTASLLTINEQALKFYHSQIDLIIEKHDPAWRLSLAELLQPLFKIAYQRSCLETAVDENKWVIMAVSRYVNQSEIQRYLPFDKLENKPQYAAFLYKRMDMAKHFMASALLTAVGNSTLAVLLGEKKELRDAKFGRGFSFIDLAGDKAGIRFGKMATENPKSARQLQQKMILIKDYRAFMPEVRDLPENISHDLFKATFGSIESPAYQLMVKEIDDRIAVLPLYQ